jgi:haloalkane dehalogenase
MLVLRTPDERFTNLPDFPFESNYLTIYGPEDSLLRVHYVDEGPRDAAPIFLLHGEPTWSFLYRKMIPPLVAAGHRVVVPDLVGFGRSDKPADPGDYSYGRMVDWTAAMITALDLQQITLFGHDWGGLIGLRLALTEPERYSRLVVANTGLPVGGEMPDAFFQWQSFSQQVSKLPIKRIINRSTTASLPGSILAAYDAPFPTEAYKAGARALPALVPVAPDDPEARVNRRLWRKLMRWQKPLLTAFSDGDPVTAGGDQPFQRLVPGAKGQPHTVIRNAGHFLQEDKGEELAQVIVDFIAANP